MVDARLSSEWLGTLRFDALSDAAWRVFSGALMWCNGSGTDGVIPNRYVPRLHPDGEQPEAFAELEKAGLWERTEDGYVMDEWDGALGQSTSAQVETYRANARQRQAKYREKERQKLARSLGLSDEGVTSDVTDDVTRHVGKAEARQGEGSGVEQVNESKKPEWNVTPIPSGPVCWICGEPAPAGTNVCGSRDALHLEQVSPARPSAGARLVAS